MLVMLGNTQIELPGSKMKGISRLRLFKNFLHEVFLLQNSLALWNIYWLKSNIYFLNRF